MNTLTHHCCTSSAKLTLCDTCFTVLVTSVFCCCSCVCFLWCLLACAILHSDLNIHHSRHCIQAKGACRVIFKTPPSLALYLSSEHLNRFEQFKVRNYLANRRKGSRAQSAEGRGQMAESKGQMTASRRWCCEDKCKLHLLAYVQ